MPCFDKEFKAAKGSPIDYKGLKLVRIDRFPIKNEGTLVCSIEKFDNTNLLQGFCIDITGHCELDGEIYKQGKGVRMLFWAGISPEKIILKVFTKKDSVVIYNINERETSYLVSDKNGEPVERHSKAIDYWIGGAAMVIEEIPNGRRYRCNDVSCTDKENQFEDIIFTIQKPNTEI